MCDIKVRLLPLVHDIFAKAYGRSSRVVRSPPSGRQNLAQGARSCENIVGGEGPLSRNAAILRVLPTAAETDYGHDIRLPFLG